MKPKFFLALLLMLAVNCSVCAQLRYGFRFAGDFAAASLKGAEGYSLVNRSGFTGGLVLEYQMPRCGFAPDIALLYSRHNVRLRADGGKPHSFGRNFLEVPVHLKYKFWLKSTHDLFAPMLMTGPVFSFRLGKGDAFPLSTKVFQPGWDVGLGFDVINFIQITGSYRFGLGNSVKRFCGFPDAVVHASGWTLAATLLFDF